MEKYNPKKIEKKWQKRWDEEKLYKADDFSEKPKKYILVEFPYPSGAGLHVGHVRSYAALDTVARKSRMNGDNVLFPMGWDAFGLPTENYAIKHKIQPRKATEDNVATFKKQLKSLGLSFDWSREINTTDPEYYKWTQWIFLQLYKKGLAYKKKMPINWCPSCKIGLAHEEVVDGKCERCGANTEQKEKEQWMLAITKYAEKLINDLDTVDYLDKIKTQQVNWIGKSEGINIKYKIEGLDKNIEVFTTRPDTNFGATFVVMAPDAKFVKDNIDLFPKKEEIEKYIKETAKKSELERIAEERKKTGVFTGLYALNNLNDKKMPIYVGDFVIASVGTGIVVGVPGHDLRDFEFAQAMDLEIIRVVVGSDGDKSDIIKSKQVQEKEGVMINSDFLDDMETMRAKEKIMNYLEEKGWGEKVTNYKLRDWVFSRQHYWGEPIPMIDCKKCGLQPVPENQLPVELPNVKNYEPTNTGESPLAAIQDWVNVDCPKCGEKAKRETDTMPNWAGSSWYFLRYLDPKNKKEFADQKKLKYWMPIDLYNGGMEHTTLHLLYSRFWNKFLYEIGVVPVSEPYAKRVSHGMVLANDNRKMSKSFGNVINPDEIVNDSENGGADTLRMYEMFMGPFGEAIPWSEDGVKGIKRFLDRVWIVINKLLKDKDQLENISGQSRLIHKTIKRVTEDIDNMKFNTAVSKLMIQFNGVNGKPDWRGKLNNDGHLKENNVDFKALEIFLKLLAPFAPHITEELWEKLGNKESIFKEKWPEYDEKFIKEDTFDLVVQISGKVRDKIKASVGISEDEALELAKSSERVKSYIDGKEIVKVIMIKDRLLNIVIK